MKFRKKPIIIEAEQCGSNLSEEFENAIKREAIGATAEGGYRYYIETLEGAMAVNYGDWIIKGVHGEFYPCMPEIFEKTYEKL